MPHRRGRCPPTPWSRTTRTSRAGAGRSGPQGGWNRRHEPCSRSGRLRPGATSQIDGAVGFLADRECVGGGWNFGNRSVYYVDLPPFGQTTAAGLIGLHAFESGYGLVLGGVDALRRLWPVEGGPLTLAMSLAAFRLLGLSDADEVEAALERTLDGPAPDVIALAWTALASGPGLSELAVPP